LTNTYVLSHFGREYTIPVKSTGQHIAYIHVSAQLSTVSVLGYQVAYKSLKFPINTNIETVEKYTLYTNTCISPDIVITDNLF